jgi:hypothetical protein
MPADRVAAAMMFLISKPNWLFLRFRQFAGAIHPLYDITLLATDIGGMLRQFFLTSRIFRLKRVAVDFLSRV